MEGVARVSAPPRTAARVALAFSALALGSCISQPILISFPTDANWHFEYHDAVGEYLGFGKAKLSFQPESRSFVMTIVENAFGDTATLYGTVGEAQQGATRVPFTAVGTWFTGERFGFAGDFNLEMNRILDCSAAWLETERQAIGASLSVLDACRAAIAGAADPDVEAIRARIAGARKLGSLFQERVFTIRARRSSD